MARAEQAITEEGLSLRQASSRFNVPKTTLAERLGDRRPKPPPRKSDEENKQRTRYQWTEADMASAIEAVRNGDKVGDAARRFGVPPSHLNSRTRGRAPKDLRGELSRLTLRQESLLADWASAQCALGCPPTKDQLFNLADRVLKKQGSDKKLGKQWIVHWMRRYPHIEILEWEPKEKERESKAKKNRTTNSAEPADANMTFSVSTFEPVIDLNDICYEATGA